MASITKDARGNRRILFLDKSGRRKPIWMGQMPLKTVEHIKLHVEALAAAQHGNTSIDPRTAAWVADLGEDIAEKLSAVGLIPRRERAQLGPFVAAYIESRKVDARESTITNLRQAERFLLEHFTAAKRLQDISPGDADDFRRWLFTKLGANTARRLLGRAKQFFRAALRKRLLAENPFGDMKGLTVQANKERQRFISREDSLKVLEACPDAQWRLLFALARWGGLRTPSEPLALCWADVDWEAGLLRVRCVKTEHHEGHGERLVPIFEEIAGPLAECFEAAEPGSQFVITAYRDANVNLRTQLHRIIKRAGLDPWEKTFQNLRSTRQTELLEREPIDIVCAIMGNSSIVALKHYAQITKERLARTARQLAQQTVNQDGMSATQPGAM